MRPRTQPVTTRCHQRSRTVRSGPRAAAASVATAPAVAEAVALRPSSAQTARTLLVRQRYATLGSISDDGWPLTTYAQYVLDGGGQPVLRLRKAAVHYKNVSRDNRVSLMVTSRDSAVGMQLQVARCTVLGHLNDNIPEKELDGIMARFKTLHAAAHGVDALREDDIYMRLNVEKVFYVGGLGTDARYATIRLFRDIADHFPFLSGASLRFPIFRRLCTCILYSDKENPVLCSVFRFRWAVLQSGLCVG